MDKIVTTQAELADIFTKMQRHYRESPELFWTPEETAADTPESYGIALAKFVAQQVMGLRATSA